MTELPTRQHHVLLIPVEGVIELLHSDLPINVEAVLKERSEGTYVALDFEVDGEPGGTVHFLTPDQGEPNFRARQAMIWLCNVHIVLDGNVGFTNVAPELVAAMVQDL
jgi:hypothetical protein